MDGPRYTGEMPIQSAYSDRANTDTNYPCINNASLASPSLLNRIFFNIKNENYEVMVMWFLIITTIILTLSLVVMDAEDRAETERVL